MKGFIKENKLTLLRLGTSICLIIAAAVFSGYNERASIALYILSYALSACLIITYSVIDLIKDRKISEKLLMAIASVGAIVVGSLFEATIIVLLFEFGELIEDIAITVSFSRVKTLKSICPDTVRLKDVKDPVKAEAIKAGDIVEVLEGERIPVDGVVVSLSGDAAVDTFLVNGDKKHTVLQDGQEVAAGYLNLKGTIYVEANGTVKQTACKRTISINRKALDKKTEYEKFIRRFSNIYTPVIILLALCIAVLPPLFSDFDFAPWIYRACSFIALSCPCALVLSVPIAYRCAINYASGKGILIKNSKVLEGLATINTMAFDKPGTLTNPVLRVICVEAVYPYSKVDVLQLACIAEQQSNHPIASAIKNMAALLRLDISEGENYEEYVGKGVECDSQYGHIASGNKSFVKPDYETTEGTIFVSLNGKYVGYIGVGDELKANCARAFNRLRYLGVNKRAVFSGEKQYKVDAVARSLLAEAAYSNLLPKHRMDAIEDIVKSTSNCKIAYCGDGSNDLDALQRADVGIAMAAAGDDKAFEKSDVIIIDHDLLKIPLAMHIAMKTKRLILGNIIFAMTVKAVLLILCLFGVVPLFVAVAGDVSVLILSILNSLRAGRADKKFTSK